MIRFILKILRNSLSFKIVVPIGILLIIWGIIFWYKFIYREYVEQVNLKTEETLLNLEIIRNNINYNMLINHAEAIEKTIENIGTIKRIPLLILLDHKGNVKFSSDKNRTGKVVRNADSICSECHSISKSGQYTVKDISKNWYINENTRQLRAFIPVKNQESCYTAPCHVHSRSASINGILVAELPLESTYDRLRDRSIDSIIYGMVFFALIIVTIYMLLSKSVIKPAVLVYEGMKMVSRGYVGHTLEVSSVDELGDIQKAYNEMTKELRSERTDFQVKTKKLSEIMEQKSFEIRKTQEQYMHTEKLAS
ncbi:MAG: hypothetical protein HQK89_11780, partial [Nitrospirae bacterium]|nr:hypothetical protein [Nitrospirota bacterium]